MSQVDSEFDQADLGSVGFDDGFDESPTDPSQPDKLDLTEAPQFRKQGFSIYSFMLILSFLFLLTAIVLLFMEIDRLS